MKTVAAAKLVALVAAIMEGGGCSAAEARTVAQRLVDSNLVGHDSHGVLRVSKYLDWVRDGTLKPNTPPTVVFESDGIAIIDGNRGFGQVTGEFATRLGIAKAARTGIAMIGLRNCGHLGRLGDWAEMAAEAGQVSLHFLNTSGRSESRPSAAATGACRPIRWRSAFRSRARRRRSSTSRRRRSPRAS